MELPDDVLFIIREYSKPITKSNWRDGCYCNYYINDFKTKIVNMNILIYIRNSSFYFDLLSYIVVDE